MPNTTEYTTTAQPGMPSDKAPHLEWALWYAIQGWPVFPCYGKKPLGIAVKHGHQEATCDETQIRLWWAQWPNANIGMPIRAGEVVLDSDPRKGGDTLLYDLQQQYGPLPDTLTTHTGGGGQHLKFTSTVPVQNKANIGLGIDVQGPGSYVILPPSIHPDTARRYVWDVAYGPDSITAQPAPAWLEALIRQQDAPAPADATPFDSQAPILEGSRETTLMRMAGSLRRQGATPDEIRALLESVNQRCVPPLEAKDLDRLTRSVGKYAPAPRLDVPGPMEQGQGAQWDPARWRAKLKYTRNGEEPKADYGNYGEIFAYHPEWHGRLTFDTFRHEPCLKGVPFDPYTATRAAHWLGTELRMMITRRQPVLDAMAEVATRTPFDPLHDFLHALKPWDRKRRLHTWLQRYFGAEDSRYTRWVCRAFLAGLLSRALQPGGIMRLCLILEGPEGNKKSAAVEVLGSPFASAMSASLEGKESHMRLKGVWVMELPELDALSRSEETRIKAFLSLTNDTYIPKYEGAPATYPRRTVFIGTTNEKEYLKGQHGNTRYLPMKTSTIDVKGLARDRDQLLAEGLVYLASTPQWWEVPDRVAPELDKQRARRKKIPVYREPILRWLSHPDTGHQNTLTMKAVMEGALGIFDLAQWPRLQQPVGEALRDLGWAIDFEWDGTEHKSRRIWVRAEEP